MADSPLHSTGSQNTAGRAPALGDSHPEGGAKKSGMNRVADRAVWLGGVAGLAVLLVLLAGREHFLSRPEESDAPRSAILTRQEIASQPLEVPPAGGSLEGLYLAARHARHIQDDRYASLALQQALLNKPDDSRLMAEAMESALRAGQIDSAAGLAWRLRSMNPEGDEALQDALPLAQLIAAVDAVRAERWTEARSTIAPLVGQGPLFQNLLFGLFDAWLQLASGQVEEALQVAEDFGRHPEITAFSEYHLALMLAQLGRYDEAEKHLETVESSAVTLPRRVAEVQANLQIVMGNPDKAKEVVDGFWKSNRDIWLEKDEVQAGLDAAGKELMIPLVKDGIAELLYGASSLAHQQGDRGMAYSFLRLALGVREDYPIAQVLLAAYYERDQRHRDAVAVYEAVAKDSPFWRRAQMERAQALAVMGEQDEALKGLRQVAKIAPESPLPWLHEGDILRQEKRFADAAKAYSEAAARLTETRDYHWPVFYMRGICYERSKQWDKAEPDFLKALSLSPDNADVLNYLAYSWLEMGKNLEKARDMLEVAVRSRPYDAHIVDSIGWAYFKLGQLDKALAYLEKAIEMMPDDATVNDHLGDVLWALGRQREAKFQWQRALLFDPEPEAAKLIEAKMEHGLPAVDGK